MTYGAALGGALLAGCAVESNGTTRRTTGESTAADTSTVTEPVGTTDGAPDEPTTAADAPSTVSMEPTGAVAFDAVPDGGSRTAATTPTWASRSGWATG